MRNIFALTFTLFFCFSSIWAEDGSALWLRYASGAKAEITSKKQSPTLRIAVSELQNFWQGGIPVTLEVRNNKELRALGNEGYTIQTSKGGSQITIASSGEQGVLYGTYHLLRLQATGQLPESALQSLNISERPDYRIRILNHWDNLDGTIERGYAGHSLWKWDELPSVVSPRYEAYARANASIGINATVINNVNASPKILSNDYLQKVKVLADVFRPYGLKIYLSINFSSPAALGGLSTSDPLNKEVIDWWKQKAKEIYSLIPDFGGFLVKANSEGQPGPCDYGRTHAEGANMLADVLRPYHGIVMWRAFVYSPTDSDRAKQAYLEFEPLDGKFRDNVIVQIKNGPIDFQPREPFSPLFGAMKKTAVMPEFQITQEYLGFSNHLAFLAPMWKECLDSDTYLQGKGSTVARVTDGSLFFHPLTAISGVANIGDDIGDEFIANASVFKKLVTGDRVNVERKGQDPFEFNNYSKFLFSANNIPRIKDKTGAVQRRLVIVPFDAKFTPNDADFRPFIKDELCEQGSMEYLALLGLQGLKRVLGNAQFTTSSRVQGQLDEYEENNNPIIGFINEVGLDGIENEATDSVYRRYKEYCIANNFQALSNIEFSRQITKRCGLVIVDKWISRLGKCRVFVESEDAE